MERLLARFRIGAQVAALGLIGMLGIVLIGCVSWWGTTQANLSAAAISEAHDARDINGNLQVLLLQARRHEKDFLLRRDERLLAEHVKTTEAAERSVDILIAN